MEYIFYGFVRSRTLREMAESCVLEHGGRVLFYCDDAGGTNAYPVSEISKHPNATIVIMCTGIPSVLEKIASHGFQNPVVVAPLLGYRFICDAYSPPEEMQRKTAGWVHEHEGELRELYCREDARTQCLLDEIINERSSFQWASVEWAKEHGAFEEYFMDEMFARGGQITLLDGGSWKGDTIEALHRMYDNRLAHIYAFEPDNKTFPILEQTVRRLGLERQTELIHAGIYNRKGILRFSNSGDMIEQDDAGDISVPICRIDDIVQKVTGDLYLKMDLEGSEIPALEGAKETIRIYRPCMAICTYHRMEDVLAIPKYISDIVPDYKFYLRSGFHTECYAVPCEYE